MPEGSVCPSQQLAARRGCSPEADMSKGSKRNEVSLGKENQPPLGDGGSSIGVVSAGGGAASAALKQELNTLKETVTGLEGERDLHFGKLRDIELLFQQACDDNPELEKEEDRLMKQVQTILSVFD
ncbi:MAG: hypothetical protein Q9215_004900 [Flavoplaca cf. flavocitrina]